ncbi:uncharacterized protein LOC118514137 isoform X3 [Anopheles stephensi]|nr:uncharacterized protein LOC118514137 isoform X3 [Anopheles stephensi]XP_035916630.1 uncharacterized protein LOC118514137 isoform X3 [Anopheles stephensi]XP_035916631.1 uncharacterized protein LOC118514137 isoform X3 [Anopheles stephensi]XP_035916632.1 uncharacterized protein LOC118514137 isoform X3 [Anopheles stephensi]
MGLPDLPGQPEDDSNFTMDENNTVHLEPLSEDESDNESLVDANGYAGYQPLNMDEQNQTNRMTSVMDEEMDTDAGEGEPPGHDGGSTVNAEFLNVDVWNAPRPNELSIDLDSSKAAEPYVLLVVFTVPTVFVLFISINQRYTTVRKNVRLAGQEFIATCKNITLPVPVLKATTTRPNMLPKEWSSEGSNLHGTRFWFLTSCTPFHSERDGRYKATHHRRPRVGPRSTGRRMEGKFTTANPPTTATGC